MKKLNLAIIGQGRSGKDIHGKYYVSDKNVYYNIKYVVELDEHRREVAKEMYPGCEVLSDYKELYTKNDIDLVVNDTYSNLHFSITKELLEHKFNVLCEKPFVRNRYECDVLENTAKENGVVLAVFQQSLYSPMYEDALRVVNDKVVGEPLQISIRYNGFSRRWDWQTLQTRMAGNVFNTGPHPLGIALGLLNFDENWELKFGSVQLTPLSSGDADDYCKAIITAPNKPIVDVEVNNTDAFCAYNIKIQGTRGTFQATNFDWKMKYIVDGENPEQPVKKDFIVNAKGNPAYCSEKLIAHEEAGEYNGTAFDVGTARLYEDLYFKITEGREMYVDINKARHTVRFIEQLQSLSKAHVKYL